MGTHDFLLQVAQNAQREGQRNEATFLYTQALRGNPYLVEAWWGLSQTVRDNKRRSYCLKRVLSITPDHAEARQRLEQLPPEVRSGHLETSGAPRPVAINLDMPLYK